MAFLISLMLGFIPMFIYAAFINWLDRYEKEPKVLLGGVFIWGAIIAAGSAFLINTVLGLGIYVFTGSETATTLATDSLIAPIVEEILKGSAVLLVFWVFHSEFDSVLDGIIYASIVALGFAATENVYYIYANGFLAEAGSGWSGWTGLWLMAFIRIILVGWQHPFYTAFFGIGLALARLNRNTLVKIIAPLVGMSLSMVTHGLHNTISPLLTDLAGLTGLLLGSILDWAGWFMMLLFTIAMIYKERKLLIQYLKDEVDLGTMTLKQYQTAYSVFGQGLAKWRALFRGQWLTALRFYQECGELAHKKNQLAHLGDEKGNTAIIEKLREELHRLSPRVPA